MSRPTHCSQASASNPLHFRFQLYCYIEGLLCQNKFSLKKDSVFFFLNTLFHFIISFIIFIEVTLVSKVRWASGDKRLS